MGVKMNSYLDNAATTRVFDSVKDVMVDVLTVDYGNPSSMHRKGLDAERYIKDAKETIAKALKVDAKEIVFTSGGTEANNLALIGTAFANKRRGNHIITTRIEHSSVHNPIIYLEENGFRVSYLSVDNMGHIDMEELKKELCDETILVSIMYVNNEIGAIQPIAEIGRIIKEKSKDILFHVDGIQAFGKLPIYPKREFIDLFSISAHKFHGPKGIGALFIKDKVKIKPILFGGGQQKGIRSGTENVSGIAGMGQAVKEVYKGLTERQENLYMLKMKAIQLLEEIENIRFNGATEEIRESAPHILSVSFAGIKSEVLLHALEDRQVYVSSGSACASNHPGLSGTLKAIGIKDEFLDASIRFSFCAFTTVEEVEYAVACVKEIVPMLRKYTKH